MLTRRPLTGTSALLHASHPLRGHPVTYRITPMVREPGAPAGFLVEQADGSLDTPEAWESVERSSMLMTARQVKDLVGRVAHAERALAG